MARAYEVDRLEPDTAADLEVRLAREDPDARAEVVAGLERGEAWASHLLRESIAADTPWAKRLMVLGLRATETWAWHCYHAWYHPMVLRICVRMLRDPDRAHDCAARVRERFIDHYAHGERPFKSFPNYVYLMARTFALKQLAELQRVLPTPDDERFAYPNVVVAPIAPPPPSGVDVVAMLIRRQQTEQLRAAFAELTSDEQELLRARYFDGKGLKEIAAERGCSHQNVDQRIKRLLERLKRQLRRSDDVPPT